MKILRQKIAATVALTYLASVICWSAYKATWLNLKAGVRGVWSIR